jgi:hypothetical protein
MLWLWFQRASHFTVFFRRGISQLNPYKCTDFLKAPIVVGVVATDELEGN